MFLREPVTACDLIFNKSGIQSLCDFVILGNEKSRRMSSLHTLLTMNGRNSVFSKTYLDILSDKYVVI